MIQTTLDALGFTGGGLFVWLLVITLVTFAVHRGYQRHKFGESWKQHLLFKAIDNRNVRAIRKHLVAVNSTVVDDRGRTPVFAAIATNMYEVVEAVIVESDTLLQESKITILQDHGGFVVRQERDFHALVYAAFAECEPLIMLLLAEKTADIGVIDEALEVVIHHYPDGTAPNQWRHADRAIRAILLQRKAELAGEHASVVRMQAPAQKSLATERADRRARGITF